MSGNYSAEMPNMILIMIHKISHNICCCFLIKSFANVKRDIHIYFGIWNSQISISESALEIQSWSGLSVDLLWLICWCTLFVLVYNMNSFLLVAELIYLFILLLFDRCIMTSSYCWFTSGEMWCLSIMNVIGKQVVAFVLGISYWLTPTLSLYHG